MKKITNAIFLLILVTPLLLWILGLESTVVIEKREIAKFPEIENAKSLKSFPRLFEKYFQDHLPFRNEIMGANAHLEYIMGGPYNNNKVIIGHDSFLFYTPSWEHIRQVQHRENPELEFNDILYKHDLLRKAFCDSVGITYLRTIYPNKHTVYQENMPYFFQSGITKNPGIAESYGSLMKDTSWYVDLLPALFCGKKSTLVYLRMDTHWSDEGAYLGYKEIANKIFKLTNDPKTLPLTNIEYEKKLMMKSSRDLVEMLMPYPDFYQHDSVIRIPNYRNSSAKNIELRNHKNPKYFYTSNEKSTSNKTLLVVGDSFIIKTRKYFKEQYRRFVHLRNEDFSRDFIKEMQPDIIIYGYVERNTMEVK